MPRSHEQADVPDASARRARAPGRLVPIVAGLVVVAVAVAVVTLLTSAANRGIAALTSAKLDQVQTTADSFNARVASEFTSVKGLGATPWKLTPDNPADLAILKNYAVDATAQSGFFLVNADGIVTSGILLRTGAVGTPAWPGGWASLKARLGREDATVLPVSTKGLTTELPSYDLVVAIRGTTATSVRGALVFESAVTASSAFQNEIAQLADRSASSASWDFIDSAGTVVASTRPGRLGRPVEDRRYRTVRSGVTHLDGDIVVTADVPSVGWRIVFREKTSQFESALNGPLQRAGLILLLLLLGMGLILVIVLLRRLREAHEQQRRLRQLTSAQAEFISVVSHELRTPVAGILGFLQTTVDHWTTLSEAERLSTVRRAVTNARRLQAMTRDVLDVETIEAGRFSYAFTRLELSGELQTAIDGALAADPTHPVEFVPAPEAVWIDADPDRLQQVLGNLLENARTNAPPGSSITVTSTVVDGERVRVSVTDHGAGVDPDARDRIFDKFVRSGENSVRGTGLGLYIARTVVEAHQGHIWCESEPGQPTRFVVELPVAHADTREALGV